MCLGLPKGDPMLLQWTEYSPQKSLCWLTLIISLTESRITQTGLQAWLSEVIWITPASELSGTVWIGLNKVERPHPKGGQHPSLGCGPEVHKKEKARRASNLSSQRLLPADACEPLSQAPSGMTILPHKTVIQNKPFLPSVALVGVFYHGNRKSN